LLPLTGLAALVLVGPQLPLVALALVLAPVPVLLLLLLLLLVIKVALLPRQDEAAGFVLLQTTQASNYVIRVEEGTCTSSTAIFPSGLAWQWL
jgi:hypothetical protein